MAQQLKVVIVHDWLYGGGAELVVLELHRMFPDAPIYTSYCTDEWRQKLDGKVITGYLNHWPFTSLRKFLPVLRQRWFRKLDLSGYDLIISSSGNGEAKFVRTGDQKRSRLSKWLAMLGAKENRKGGVHVGTATADRSLQQHSASQSSSGVSGSASEQTTAVRKPVHICYCHTPTHFYWRHYDEYLKNPGFGILSPVARLGLKLLVKPLRNRDYKAAQQVDQFIANSSHIQNDIKQYYRRDSVVIHPPVDISRFETLSSKKRRGFVTVGRQVPYKKVAIIVDACTQLNLPLTVIGKGPQHDDLVKRAGPNVTFKTNASDSEVSQAMQSAEAFIIAAFEDFGITPVEAMAAGTPVIAYKAGGALDYVIPGKTGEFFDAQTTESLVKTLDTFTYSKYVSSDIKTHARNFSNKIFRQKIQSLVNHTKSATVK